MSSVAIVQVCMLSHLALLTMCMAKRHSWDNIAMQQAKLLQEYKITFLIQVM